jgi:hypothetical protein
MLFHCRKLNRRKLPASHRQVRQPLIGEENEKDNPSPKKDPPGPWGFDDPRADQKKEHQRKRHEQ